jgi:hypothetical protein
MGKMLLNYEAQNKKLGQKEDHLKNPFDGY